MLMILLRVIHCNINFPGNIHDIKVKQSYCSKTRTAGFKVVRGKVYFSVNLDVSPAFSIPLC